MVYKFINFLLSKNLRTFLISLVFHFSLYFSTSNKVTFLLSLIFLVALYQHLKKISLTLFFVFFTMLPFAKGKGIDILLLDKKFVLKNAIFNIDYLFPIYISSFYLTCFYLYSLRRKIFFKIKKIKLTLNTKMIIGLFSLFIVSTAATSITSIFSFPIILSSIQLFILLLIFFIPFILKLTNKMLVNFYQIIVGSTLFQSLWLIAQTLNKGHLNRDIEVFLPGAEFGVRSTENNSLMRLTGTFFESSILGTFLLTNISIFIFLLLHKRIKNIKTKKIIQLTVFISSFAIILTGSRAIYLIFFLLTLYIAKLKNLFSKKSIQSFFSTVKKNKFIFPLLIAGVMFVSPYLVNRLGSSNQLFSKEGSGTYRIQISQYSLRLTENKPFFGVGLNLSPYYLATSFPQEDYFFDPAHPHNIMVQLLAETGIIGTTLFTLFIYLSFRMVLFSKKKKLNEFTLSAIIFFLCAQVYPIFINQMEIISYLFLYLGFSTYYIQKNADKK